jgi:hypothetical protein
MIELSYTIDARDIVETQQFIAKVVCKEISCRGYNGPVGFIKFAVNGQNMNWCDELDEDELLPFALGLNTTLHSIKVGEQIRDRLSDSGLSLYYKLIDPQTILLTPSPSIEETEILCDFNDLKLKAESFCLALYNDIMLLFPGFFEAWELGTGGIRNEQGETQSEEIIRKLHLK